MKVTWTLELKLVRLDMFCPAGQVVFMQSSQADLLTYLSLEVLPDILNVENFTPTWFQVEKNLRQKFISRQIAVISKVYPVIHNLIKIPKEYTVDTLA